MGNQVAKVSTAPIITNQTAPPCDTNTVKQLPAVPQRIFAVFESACCVRGQHPHQKGPQAHQVNLSAKDTDLVCQVMLCERVAPDIVANDMLLNIWSVPYTPALQSPGRAPVKTLFW